MTYACVNGTFTPLEEAKISLSDRGFLFGHSIFETILVLDDRIIGWDEHYARMENSCEQALIALPEESLLKKWVNKVIALSKETASSRMQLRIIATGGDSFVLPIHRKNGFLPEPNVVIFCRNVPDMNQDQNENVVTLKSFPDLRSQALISIKHCSYLYNLLALENAKAGNFDDALFYNSKNELTECTTANFIWFDQSNTIYSAPFEGNCLAGTTLMRLISALEKQNQIPFVWQTLKREEIASACGCAILSSVRGLVPVQKIDDYVFDVAKQRSFFAKLANFIETA